MDIGTWAARSPASRSLLPSSLGHTLQAGGWCALSSRDPDTEDTGQVETGRQERRGWELETIYLYDWVQRSGGLATTLQSHTSPELELQWDCTLAAACNKVCKLQVVRCIRLQNCKLASNYCILMVHSPMQQQLVRTSSLLNNFSHYNFITF